MCRESLQRRPRHNARYIQTGPDLMPPDTNEIFAPGETNNKNKKTKNTMTKTGGFPLWREIARHKIRKPPKPTKTEGTSRVRSFVLRPVSWREVAPVEIHEKMTRMRLPNIVPPTFSYLLLYLFLAPLREPT